ncbi:MAG: NAD-dependent epimerase/dehydratase family protein [Methanoregula sp.]|jgi:UDP-glucose 4-epimerase|uniref:NAD-dependent epimerase/dehydratase family protein n=1 Tax=Methanoregula sp. TaxID=2052170 RepID=UPI003C1B0778
MRALVTGCAGFIGSHLTDRLLAEGYEVTGIDCFTDYYPRKIKESNIRDALQHRNFTFIENDILAMSVYPDVDFVFHEAAQAGVRASWGSSFSIYTRNNIEATQRLLEYYKDRPLKKFVYASSSSVYGDAPLPMREDMRPQPVSPYGVSKLAAEHLCYLYWKNFGLPTISLRYFTVYGPRQRPDMAINKFVKAIMDGTTLTLYGDGSQTRDFTFVSDIVEANILASRYKEGGEVFNIGGGSRITVNSLLSVIEKSCGKKAKVIYEARQKGDALDTLADVQKAGDKLGWNPAIFISTGIKLYQNWYLEKMAIK